MLKLKMVFVLNYVKWFFQKFFRRKGSEVYSYRPCL